MRGLALHEHLHDFRRGLPTQATPVVVPPSAEVDPLLRVLEFVRNRGAVEPNALLIHVFVQFRVALQLLRRQMLQCLWIDDRHRSWLCV